MNVRFLKNTVLEVESESGEKSDIVFVFGQYYQTKKIEISETDQVADIFLDNGYVVRGVPCKYFENNNTPEIKVYTQKTATNYDIVNNVKDPVKITLEGQIVNGQED